MSVHPMQTGSNFNTKGKNTKTIMKKKVNPIGDQKVVDYMDIKFLSRFTNDQGKILPKRITGVSAYQQRQISKAIKYARHLALMPFVNQDIA